MGLTIRPSHPSLSAVGRALSAARTELVVQWANWISSRTVHANTPVSRPSLERQLGLLVDILVSMTGPIRRRAAQLWFNSCEHYGRAAAIRGLAAGEVVEELQHLRELLIRQLSETIAALPARYSLAAVLRLNRQVDHGIARAVVGYTDALVETLLNQNGVPESDSALQMAELEAELERVRNEGRETRDE